MPQVLNEELLEALHWNAACIRDRDGWSCPESYQSKLTCPDKIVVAHMYNRMRTSYDIKHKLLQDASEGRYVLESAESTATSRWRLRDFRRLLRTRWSCEELLWVISVEKSFIDINPHEIRPLDTGVQRLIDGELYGMGLEAAEALRPTRSR